MGRASRKKRELREMEMEDLPEELRFGPEFIHVVAQAGVATATGKGGNS